ncbi:MAG: MBL fold metallo-hydrolase [Rubrivivax sp.]
MPDDAHPAQDTQGLSFPCGAPPAVGQAREVLPGLLWLRMPLPFVLDHINLWALREGEGWAIVDSGVQTPAVLAAWSAMLAADGALGGLPVTRVFATHLHPDHIGMAGWLTRKFDCRLWTTRQEYLMCRTLMSDTGRTAPDDAIRFYRRCGWPTEALDLYRARFGGFGRHMHTLPDSYRRLVDGERLRLGEHEWRVVVGRGHSPEHACLVCDELQVMISGDQVLPRITSNISVFPMEPEADPLADWLDSIAQLRARLTDTLLVLPAHGEPFRGLHARLEQLAQGHARGLAQLERALAEPRRVVDLFGTLFTRQIDSNLMQFGFATGETVAHLNHLVARGRVRILPGDDGVWRYRAQP